MWPYAAFHLGVHCLSKYPFRGSQNEKGKHRGTYHIAIKEPFNPLLHLAPFDAFEISRILKYYENGAFALLEQMLHFP